MGTNDQFPEIGAVFAPGSGFWGHQRNFLHGAWLIAKRAGGARGEVEEIDVCRTSKEAAARFQRARLEDCGDGEVVEALNAVLGGWRLLDQAPRLAQGNASIDEDVIREYVWRQDGECIGMTWPERAGRWVLVLAGEQDSTTGQVPFESAPRTRDRMHWTRKSAVDTAQALRTGEDVGDRWFDEWTGLIGRMQKAGIGTTFTHDMLLLGPTGTRCAVPDCAEESAMKITRSGSDIGVESRMTCPDHAALILAHHGPPPDGP